MVVSPRHFTRGDHDKTILCPIDIDDYLVRASQFVGHIQGNRGIFKTKSGLILVLNLVLNFSISLKTLLRIIPTLADRGTQIPGTLMDTSPDVPDS